MKLEIDEFIRRFLLHVLPSRFFKVRYYGIFASRYRSEDIATAKQLLEQEKNDQKQELIEDGNSVFENNDTVWHEIISMIQKFQKPNCPQCRKGRLRFAGLAPG